MRSVLNPHPLMQGSILQKRDGEFCREFAAMLQIWKLLLHRPSFVPSACIVWALLSVCGESINIYIFDCCNRSSNSSFVIFIAQVWFISLYYGTPWYNACFAVVPNCPSYFWDFAPTKTRLSIISKSLAQTRRRRLSLGWQVWVVSMLKAHQCECFLLSCKFASQRGQILG